MNAVRGSVLMLLAGAAPGAAAAQDLRPIPQPKLQPTVTDLGTVAVGATVEASFGVFWTDAALAREKALVDAPFGAVVQRIETSAYSERALTQVEFALDTATARDVDATFTVRCGSEKVTVPLRAKVIALPKGGSRVLIAESPFEAFSCDDPAVLDAWRKIVEQARLDVDYRLARPGRATFDVAALSRVDVVLAAEGALTELDDGQVAKLHGFVCGGGRVVVFANAFFQGTVHGANRLSEAFDLRIRDRESAAGAKWTADAAGLARHPLTAGIEGLDVHRPSPVEIAEGERAVVLVNLTAPAEQPFAALVSTASGGEMIAVGESLWWNTAGKSPGFARLLRNVLSRPPRLR